MAGISYSIVSKRSALSLCVITALLAAQPASAYFNLYKKDGMAFDLYGGLEAYATKDSSEYNFDASKNPRLTHIVDQTYNERLTDEQVRLGHNNNSAYMGFRATQIINKDWTATGNIQLSYQNTANVDNANISLARKGVGNIAVGRQWLHSIRSTGTYSVMSSFADTALRADYIGMPNLHVSGYYLFPELGDTRKYARDTSYQAKSGFGVSGLYTFDMGARNTLDLGLAYADRTHNVDQNSLYWETAPNPAKDAEVFYSIWTPKKITAFAGSAKWQYNNLAVAVDAGQSVGEINSDNILKETTDPVVASVKDVTTKAYGVKVGIDVNPKLNLNAKYGVRTLSYDVKGRQNVIGNVGTEGWERYVPDSIDSDIWSVGADYKVLSNITAAASYSLENHEVKLDGRDLATKKDNRISLGLIYEF